MQRQSPDMTTLPHFDETFGKSVLNADFSQTATLNSLGSVSFEAVRTHQKDIHPREQYELVIAVNTCVNAICRNISQVKIRILDRSGREVVGGQLYDLLRRPAPNLSQRKFLWELASWFNIAGEIVAAMYPLQGDMGIGKMYPLDPFNLSPMRPANPKVVSDIELWRYYWKCGQVEQIRSDYVLFEKMFNPKSDIRGLSPLTTGSTEIATGHHLSRYNKSFFENNAIPSHLLMLGEGVGTAQRRDVEERYKSEFAAYNGNAHKVMVVSGKNARVETLEQPFQDGAFMELRKSILQSVAMLYRVPAIEAGLYDKTRFDTAAEERKLFVESTLKPQCDLISDMLQHQLVDRHYAVTNYNRERSGFEKSKMSKAFSDQYEQALYERSDSNLIVLLDTNTLPIMASVNASLISTAKDFREVLDLSANETAHHFKIDIPEREERDDIWKNRSYINISNPDMNRELLEGELRAKQEINATAHPNNPENDEEDDNKNAEVQSKKKAIKTLLSHIRKTTLDSIDAGRLWSLSEADEMVGDSVVLRKAVRVIRNELRTVLEQPDPKQSARDILNDIDADALSRQL